jgi:hypothetical protein
MERPTFLCYKADDGCTEIAIPLYTCSVFFTSSTAQLLVFHYCNKHNIKLKKQIEIKIVFKYYPCPHLLTV